MDAIININSVTEDKNPSSDSAMANIDSGPSGHLPFQLQKGEKILRELKPQFLGFILTKTLGSYIILGAVVSAILILYLAVRINFLGFLVQSRIILGLPILAVLLPIMILLIALKPLIVYGKLKYWVTDHRVIGKRGFLGYSIDSIPLENVSDVVISRKLVDRLLGLSSLIIVPMSGGRGRDTSDGENGSNFDNNIQNSDFFAALTYNNAMELQKLLFNLRDIRKNPQKSDQPVGARISNSAKSNESSSRNPDSNNRSNINV